MIQTIRKAWGIPELRKKIVFTLLILLIFRAGRRRNRMTAETPGSRYPKDPPRKRYPKD